MFQVNVHRCINSKSIKRKRRKNCKLEQSKRKKEDGFLEVNYEKS